MQGIKNAGIDVERIERNSKKSRRINRQSTTRMKELAPVGKKRRGKLNV